VNFTTIKFPRAYVDIPQKGILLLEAPQDEGRHNSDGEVDVGVFLTFETFSKVL
jgi:hypothetical protein